MSYAQREVFRDSGCLKRVALASLGFCEFAGSYERNDPPVAQRDSWSLMGGSDLAHHASRNSASNFTENGPQNLLCAEGAGMSEMEISVNAERNWRLGCGLSKDAPL